MLELSPSYGDRALGAGDVVRTDDDAPSLAEVVHRNGAVTRLDRGTQVTVEETRETGTARIVVRLGPGRTWHDTGALDDATFYEARSDAAVVTARHAVFVATVDPSGACSVAVVRGTAVVQGVTAGSVIVADGQVAEVSAWGRAAAVHPQPLDPSLAAWVALNEVVADDGAQGEDGDDSDVPALLDDGAPASAPLPRWATWMASVLGAAAFVALLAMTFVTAQRGERHVAATRPPGEPSTNLIRVGPEGRAIPPVATAAPSGASPLPAGGMAMIQAAQDRRVAPEPRGRPAATAPSTTAPAAPAAAPTATAAATSCVQRGRTIVLSGTLANTGGTEASFVVTASFTDGSGTRFATTSTTVGPVAPGRTAQWTTQATAAQDLRGTGASCDVAGVRPA